MAVMLPTAIAANAPEDQWAAQVSEKGWNPIKGLGVSTPPLGASTAITVDPPISKGRGPGQSPGAIDVPRRQGRSRDRPCSWGRMS